MGNYGCDVCQPCHAAMPKPAPSTRVAGTQPRAQLRVVGLGRGLAPVVPHVLHTTQPGGQQGRNETREQTTALNIPCVSANAEFHWFRELNFPFRPRHRSTFGPLVGAWRLDTPSCKCKRVAPAFANQRVWQPTPRPPSARASLRFCRAQSNCDDDEPTICRWPCVSSCASSPCRAASSRPPARPLQPALRRRAAKARETAMGRQPPLSP